MSEEISNLVHGYVRNVRAVPMLHIAAAVLGVILGLLLADLHA